MDVEISADLQKLPKWAQNRITKLEADLAYYKAQVAQIQGEEETDVFRWGYPEDQPLPSGSVIRFAFIKGEKQLRQSVSVQMQNGLLVVNATWPIRVKPKASNAFEVELDQ